MTSLLLPVSNYHNNMVRVHRDSKKLAPVWVWPQHPSQLCWTDTSGWLPWQQTWAKQRPKVNLRNLVQNKSNSLVVGRERGVWGYVHSIACSWGPISSTLARSISCLFWVIQLAPKTFPSALSVWPGYDQNYQFKAFDCFVERQKWLRFSSKWKKFTVILSIKCCYLSSVSLLMLALTLVLAKNGHLQNGDQDDQMARADQGFRHLVMLVSVLIIILLFLFKAILVCKQTCPNKST